MVDCNDFCVVEFLETETCTFGKEIFLEFILGMEGDVVGFG